MIRPQTLTQTARGDLIIDDNPRRVYLMVQNQGPGRVALQRRDFDRMSDGIQLEVSGMILDTVPGIWRGRWYAMTDQANTILTITEEIG